MDILIRSARLLEYEKVEALMEQVQQMHIDWRPDIYRHTDAVLPRDAYEQMIKENTLYVGEYEGEPVGVLSVMYRHVESPTQVTRNVIFIDAMVVDEAYRGKGIGHAFFDFLKQRKKEMGYDGIELQVNARNRAAYQMYADYGFTEKSINMELL